MPLFERTKDHHCNYYAAGVVLNELSRQYDAACDREDWAACDRLRAQIRMLIESHHEGGGYVH